MKKKALRKDFLMEIKKTLNRFLSILLIVALGVAFYSGIQSAAPDMRYTGDAYFDENHLMDLKVISTMGLTEEDVEAISQVKGVETVEAGYMTDVLSGDETEQKVLHVESMGEQLNLLTPEEGRIPEKSGECFVDIEFLNSMGYEIGDTISFYLDDEDDYLLKRHDFTIVGAGSSPLYISYNRGNTTLGTGELSGAAYVLAEDFDSEVYVQVYLTVSGASNLTAYTDAYDTLIETVQERIEEIAGERCEIRYAEVLEDANEEIADAEEELADGKEEAESELADAWEEIYDGEQELIAGKLQLVRGQRDIADGEEELADGEEELADGEQTLADSEQELADGKSQLEDGWAQYNSGKEEFDKQKEEFEETYDSSMKTITEGETQLAAAKEQLEAQRADYESGKAQYDEQVTQLEAAEEQYAAGVTALEKSLASATGESTLEAQKSSLETKKTQCEAGISQLSEPLTQAQAAVNAAQAQVDAAQTQANQANAAVIAAESTLQTLQAEQAALENQLTEANASLSSWKQEKSEKKTELEKANTELSEKNSSKTAKEQEKSTFESEKQTLESEKQELESEKQTLDAKADNTLTEAEKNRKSALAGLISSKETEISAKETAISAKAEEIAALETEISNLQTSISYLTSQINTLDSQISEAEALPDKIESKKAEVAAAQQTLADSQAAAEESQTALSTAQAALTTAQQTLTALQTQSEQLQASLSQIQTGLDSITQLTTTRTQLDTWKTQLDAAKASLEEFESAEAQIEEKEAELESGKQQLESGKAQIEAAQKKLESSRQTLLDSQAQLEEGEAELEDGRQELEDGRQELEDAKEELEDAKEELADGEEEIAENEPELRRGKIAYARGQKKAETTIADGEEKLEDARQEVEDLETPEWTVSDRSDLPENIGYGENADRMRSIGRVFPALFFLVAALISLTTMTRMVKEERTQIGTMKALGYSKGSIMSKYLCYALFATLGGSVIGALFGEKFLPFVIVTAYKIMYQHMPNLELPYNVGYAVAATGAALFCTMVGALSACWKALRETPAVLMRPPAPKEGKRVFLEHIPFLWKRLSFSWKSSLRNLFRYKKRFFMTIFGIGGCMALMVVGYGLRDSISDIAHLQFETLQLYDGMVILDTDAESEQMEEVVQAVQTNEKVANSTETLMKKVEVHNGKKTWNIYLMVPQNVEEAQKFLVFRDRTSGETYELTDEGAILTEKIASMMGVEAGDTITLEDEDDGAVEVPVVAITENYLSHYIYLTPALYEQCYGREPEYNEVMFQAAEETTDEELDALGQEFLDYEGSLSISYSKTTMSTLDSMLSTLDSVMIVLIISAGLLAFVVLYNLNNININERKRELATIKVLGFYDGEVDAYVYRENILITLIGMVAGVFLGKILHQFTITTVEVDATMFGRNVSVISYLTAAGFTALFSLLVNGFMHFRLKKIDMVESLKSVE